MTFLNPLFLFGLFAAAIPIVIHLLNLRKIRTIEFSTLAFLKELERTQIRRIKLRQLILLILRTLLIIFIVLAFARPALRGTGGLIGIDARSTAAIIFDNSASMQIYDEHGSLYRQAMSRSLDILDLARDGDHLILIRQSDLPEATTNLPSADRDRFGELIRLSSPAAAHRSFHDALQTARRLLEYTPHLNKELYIISDMQASHWREDNKVETPAFDAATRTYIIPLGPERVENISIRSVRFRSTLFESGKPASLEVGIENHGFIDSRNHPVSVYLNGVRVAQHNLDIPAGSSIHTEFPITPDRTGLLEGYVELEEDAFEADNRYYFTFSVPDRLAVLFVSPTREEIRFIEAAFSARGDDSGLSAMRIDHSTPESFPAIDISSYDVIVSCNVPVWSDAQAERLARYTAEGGGLILFPGESIDIGNYNSTLFDRLKLPAITGMQSFEAGATLRFGRIDYDHPVFSGIFDDQLYRTPDRERIESPQIGRHISFGGHSALDAPVISTSDGNVFMLAGRRGSGGVILFSVKPALDWSDFPLRGIFVPLINRSGLFVSADERLNESYIAGESFNITVPPLRTAGDVSFSLIHPDGTEERIQPILPASGASYQFSISTAAVTGIYTITADGEAVKNLSVNPHPGESDGTKIPERELVSILESYGLQQNRFMQADEATASVVHESRYGTELWKTFLILALIAAAAETMLSRETARKKETAPKLS